MLRWGLTSQNWCAYVPEFWLCKAAALVLKKIAILICFPHDTKKSFIKKKCYKSSGYHSDAGEDSGLLG